MTTKDCIGYIAALLCLGTIVVYLIAILKGKVHSSKVTWGIWSAVTAISSISYYKVNGFDAPLLVLIAYFVGTLISFILLCVNDKKKAEWTLLDKACLGLTVLTLVLWAFTGSLTAMSLILLVDVFGAVPLVVLVYKTPAAEYAPAWVLGLLANALNLLAVKAWDYEHAAYPIYLAAMTGIVAALVSLPKLMRRKA